MAYEPVKVQPRSRTEDLRKEIEAAASGWRRHVFNRSTGWGLVVCLGLTGLVAFAAIWASGRPLVEAGRVMADTRTVRTEFRVVDETATEQAKAAARLSAPRVYVALKEILDDTRRALESLPEALGNVEEIDAVEPTLVAQLGLTQEGLDDLRQYRDNGKVSDRYLGMVRRLYENLCRTPILDAQTYQLERAAGSTLMDLRVGARPAEDVPKLRALDAGSPGIADELRALAAASGFSGPTLDVVVARLMNAGQPGPTAAPASPTQPSAVRPTFQFDSALTVSRQELAARRVEPKTVTYTDREVIFRRGDVLTPTQLDVFRTALREEAKAARPVIVWGQRGVLAALIAAIVLAIAGYSALFVRPVRNNPARMAALAGLLGVSACIAIYASAMQPGLIALTAVTPTVLCAVILAIAYSQRVALGYASLHALLVCAALGLGVGTLAVMLAGVGAVVWRLKELRDRDTLIWLGFLAALAMGSVTLVATLAELPLSMAALKQAATDAGLAAFGGLTVSGLTLFILPALERGFGITTGMTLIELRDPKNPLLRQLQQRAPGTYNHSLNLAALGEAAADAIGADSLLTYVGALYHDIGKMNKPDYFVENQSPGFNRHDKLSPAMSLLIIVGHVKDGMELAREFGLPRPLWHFIESHHGTTLVEYFFNRARRQAEASVASGDGAEAPTELEYQYPGPRPRTREAAIIMICDAVESATRAMADPTPARIDALVRAIATKRLMDGQFDECELTLRELNTIVEAVSKTLASIYHGRIAYPGGPERPSRTGAEPKTAVALSPPPVQVASTTPASAVATVRR